MISLNSPPGNTSPTLEKTKKHLEIISDHELLGDLQKLTIKERRLEALVLLYLSEIDKRRLYLPLGYSSLFDFCTVKLKYTRATAVRRIRAAATKYPEALEMLRSGEITITALSMISEILTPDNHREMLAAIKNRSTRHVEMLVSRRRPVPVIRDTVRPICVRRRVEISPETPGAGSSAETGASSSADSPQHRG